MNLQSIAKAFNKNEPRDKDGQWAAGGVDYSNLKTMPSEIEGVSITKKASSTKYLAVGNINGIQVNTSKSSSAVWKDMAAYQQKAFASGWHSSPHPNHVVWHELGHVKTKRENTSDHDSRLSNINPLFDSHFKEMASKVSQYAGTNGQEFVAEVFAGHRAGRVFDPEVLKYYAHLGGAKL